MTRSGPQGLQTRTVQELFQIFQSQGCGSLCAPMVKMPTVMIILLAQPSWLLLLSLKVLTYRCYQKQEHSWIKRFPEAPSWLENGLNSPTPTKQLRSLYLWENAMSGRFILTTEYFTTGIRLSSQKDFDKFSWKYKVSTLVITKVMISWKFQFTHWVSFLEEIFSAILLVF